ncbi:peptidoglycan-binding protein [Kitasatospora sp. NBC_01560]|uniref:peptidoglycan-binding domain-containing protein n=1 Tax=Kitasatospora sp. NBC_01560 TaxID=2975965 RepID=UPI00386C730F
MQKKWALRAATLTLGAGAVIGLGVGSASAASNLQVGSSGSAVVCLQQALDYVDSGNLNADGQFGQLTKNAVVHYQGGHSLNPDGVVGPATGGSIKSSVRQAYDNAHHAGDLDWQRTLGAWMSNCNGQLPG